MKRTTTLGIVCCLLAAVATAEDFDFEKVKSKSNEKKSETLVFKGFYLGMPIADAQGLINHYMGLQQASATPVVNTNSATTNPVDDVIAQALLGSLAQMGVATEDTAASYQVFKKNDHLVLAKSDRARPFAVTDANGTIVLLELSKSVRNRLFDAADMPTQEFLQTFIQAYNIPKMEAEQIQLLSSIFDIQQEAGTQSILRHRSPKGFEITYYDALLWTADDAQSFVNYVPEEYITIKKIEPEKSREFKFD